MDRLDFRQARYTLGLTQQQMAAALGLKSAASVSDREEGRRLVTGPERRLIAAYLDGYRPADWPAG